MSEQIIERLEFGQPLIRNPLDLGVNYEEHGIKLPQIKVPRSVSSRMKQAPKSRLPKRGTISRESALRMQSVPLAAAELPDMDGNSDREYKRSYTRNIIVASTDYSRFGAIAAVEYVGIYPGYPNAYANYLGDYDLYAWCTGWKVKNLGDAGNCFVVTLSYETTNYQLINSNPIQVTPIARYDKTTFETVITQDQNQKTIKTSAKGFYDPPPTRENVITIINIERNESVFDQIYADQFHNLTNSDSFFGIDPGQLLLTDIKGEQQTSSEIGDYYKVTYSMRLSPFSWGWKLNLMDADYCELDSNGNRTRILLNEVGAESGPSPLDGAGGVLDRTVDGWESNIVWNQYDVYGTLDFTGTFEFGDYVIGLTVP